MKVEIGTREIMGMNGRLFPEAHSKWGKEKRRLIMFWPPRRTWCAGQFDAGNMCVFIRLKIKRPGLFGDNSLTCP